MEGQWNADCTAEREFPLKHMEITPLPCLLNRKEDDGTAAEVVAEEETARELKA